MILFSFVGGHGHFLPLVPFARVAADAGHEIEFVTSAAMAPTVRAAGFGCPSRPDPGSSADRRPLLAVDRAREERDLREQFARDGSRGSAARVLKRCAARRPDLIVCDEVDFGAMIAAEKLGIPYATVITGVAGGFVRPDVVAATLDVVRAEHGLRPDPDLAMPGRYLVLVPAPVSFRDPAFPLPPTAYHVRPVTPVSADGPRVVYFTLGTVFNTESGDLFGRVLAGLRELPVELVVTVGRHVDPAEFGPQPANVHIERYVPQERILPRCDLMVSHGGSGSVMGALAHGVPMVLVPMGADQPWNGDRCVALGVGQVLDPVAAMPADVAASASTVLTERRYRRAAARLRDEIAALPDPATALPRLERLMTRS